ncbi:P-loop containing nucleoside triphosphate hydrolase protein [Tribonema minus]|uniref:P-loop containing nucleoside triphosphate hydrolase protein n=1 Tax=Tribonema minus TaxID=303371 RepID=A0A835YUZ3_9STRA|nr:P-loop containing nucleoside triphosphate hydrolase protein [Tribonema minus]
MDERTVVAITRKQGATAVKAPRDGNAQQVYERTAQPAVQGLLENPWPTTVTETDKPASAIMILVVGATNAGKTHTVMGAKGGRGMKGDPGILPRTLEEIFQCPGDRDVNLQMVEIYNGRLKDLLPKSAGLTVQREGNRHTFDNGINEGSSRGHMIAIISLQAKTQTRKIWVVDMAGSERHNEGSKLMEALEEGLSSAHRPLGLTIIGAASAAAAEAEVTKHVLDNLSDHWTQLGLSTVHRAVHFNAYGYDGRKTAAKGQGNTLLLLERHSMMKFETDGVQAGHVSLRQLNSSSSRVGTSSRHVPSRIPGVDASTMTEAEQCSAATEPQQCSATADLYAAYAEGFAAGEASAAEQLKAALTEASDDAGQLCAEVARLEEQVLKAAQLRRDNAMLYERDKEALRATMDAERGADGLQQSDAQHCSEATAS